MVSTRRRRSSTRRREQEGFQNISEYDDEIEKFHKRKGKELEMEDDFLSESEEDEYGGVGQEEVMPLMDRDEDDDDSDEDEDEENEKEINQDDMDSDEDLDSEEEIEKGTRYGKCMCADDKTLTIIITTCIDDLGLYLSDFLDRVIIVLVIW